MNQGQTSVLTRVFIFQHKWMYSGADPVSPDAGDHVPELIFQKRTWASCPGEIS